MWILVAFVLRSRDVFNQCNYAIARKMELRGGDSFSDDVNLSTTMISGPMLGRMASIRQYILSIVLDLVKRSLEKCAGINSFGEITGNTEDCALIAFRSLVKGLKKCGWWPQLPEMKLIHQSVNQVMEQLGKIQVRGYPGHNEETCRRPRSGLAPTIVAF
ncbi:hypothetical protein P154DRAFT_229711 [Amniculicola lignicola CBS 123094]|uniref:Uncharacterized protein n=1 Tax=Amniculicola lignicola CBS 123094 TaxID=1392246 RepID=A0A6A5WEM0_9PLEO|nr:hypothetical protein P154DRAFT_229711 [Amniculicola lignicola CBS 123094]